MEKTENIEKSKREQEANDILEHYREVYRKKMSKLTEDQRDFVNICNGIPNEHCELFIKLREGLENGTYKNPSEFFEHECAFLFANGADALIAERFRGSFLYETDNCNKYPYHNNSSRRSFRVKDYARHLDNIKDIVSKYSGMYIDRDLASVLDGSDLDEYERAFCRYYLPFTNYHIAYLIDKVEETAVNWLKNILDEDSKRPFNSYYLKAVMMTENEELIELVGKLLISAELQEGLRQAVCDCCDQGTPTAFKNILRFIRDNDLIRFTSVKKSVATWCGLLSLKTFDLENLNDKTMELICELLGNEAQRHEYLCTEDDMKIWLALWAYGVDDAGAALERINELKKRGSLRQFMTAELFMQALFPELFKASPAKQYICDRPHDVALVAMCLPLVINDMLYYIGEGDMYEELRGLPYNRAKRELEDYFKDEEEELRMFDALCITFEKMTEKEFRCNNTIFHGSSATVSKAEIAQVNALIACATEDEVRIEKALSMVSEIPTSGTYSKRAFYTSILLRKLPEEKRHKCLVELLGDKNKSMRGMAYGFLKNSELTPEEYRGLEPLLKLKTEDMRLNVINMLVKQKGNDLRGCVERLLSDKSEEKRIAGLDILLNLMNDEERSAEYKQLCQLTKKINSPSVREQIILEQLTVDEQETEEYGHGLYSADDSWTPVINEKYIEECKQVFLRYYPASKALGGKDTLPDLKAILDKLDRLIDEHKNDEFTNDNGEEVLIGNSHSINTNQRDESHHRIIAMKEVWDKFYEDEICSPENAYMLLCAFPDTYRGIVFENYERYAYGLIPFTEKELSLAYPKQMSDILHYLMYSHVSRDDLHKIRFMARELVLGYDNYDDLYTQRTSYSMREGTHVTRYVCAAREVIPYFGIDGYSQEHFAEEFSQYLRIFQKFSDKKHTAKFGTAYGYPSFWEYFRAVCEGVISERFLYKHFFEESMDGVKGFEFLCNAVWITRERGRYGYNNNETKYFPNGVRVALSQMTGIHTPELDDEVMRRVRLAEKVYDELITIVLDTELKRGDSLTEYSGCIKGISSVYGVDRFVQILCAMGKDNFERLAYGVGDTPTRRESLSYLLSRCTPSDGDNAEKLKAALEGKGISEKRLVEAALLSTDWIEIIGELLGWKGFTSACYYFIAHTDDDIPARRAAVIARYTPLKIYDLRNGVFALDWFREAYAEIGEKRFNAIYDAAKYISSGARHTRARKYADAALGKLDPVKADEAIHKKRDKDMLSAYMLMPVRDEQDMTERYLSIQRFKKESKAYGSQRRASEAEAADTAMKNLAISLGFNDVTRLELIMEKAIFDNITELTEPRSFDDVTLRLTVDEVGKTDIEVLKNGKKQKSVPAKLKKDDFVIKLKEIQKSLAEQYSRTKNMFELAMEDRTVFRAKELIPLLDNPVTAPIIGRLVYMKGECTGFLIENGLLDFDGNITVLFPDDELITAHPYDLYKAEVWRSYQQYIFDNGIVQPFKQVFRELYVKTDEEKEKHSSMRYAGSQILPKQTIACLKSRRWTLERDNGLMRVFYKQNITAKINALADWYSPSDIESPTLEWVGFYDRLTNIPIKISDVPDVVFSEVMRDTDLVVSVAHAGKVDPESSHSTVEMRRAICEFTAKLFKLDNVRFEKSHMFISGKRADYAVHLGSGVVHVQGGIMINVFPVHTQQRGKIFMPFVDDDPKTAQIVTEMIMFADDMKIKDPSIVKQIK